MQAPARHHPNLASLAVLALSIGATEVPAQIFTDRTADLGLAPGNGPAAWGDLNGDGWPDLYCGGAVWVNLEGKSFTRMAAPGAGVLADIDNDGDGDLISFAPIAIYRNRGDGAAGERFEPVPLPRLPDTVSRGAAIGDFNGDGLLDAYFGGFENWETQTTYPDLLLLSDRAGGFTLAMTFPGWRARGVTACDFDEDSDLDIYVSNYRLQPNILWVNDGEGKFSDQAGHFGVLATSPGFRGGHSIGACWGDFDGDGRFDLFAGNFAHVDTRGDQPKSRFLRSRGIEHGWAFEDMGERAVWYQESYASPACADYDNDGRLDLYFTTVYAEASFGKRNYPVLYRNEGGWSFKDATEGSGLEKLPPTYQAAWADVDRDGDPDLLTAGRLYVNSAPAGNQWLALRLIGDGARVNTGAVGAQARIRLPDGTVLTRQVEAGTGEGNANSPILHFGLGTQAGPLAVEIRWPDGRAVTVPAVVPGGSVVVRYDRDAAPDHTP